MRITTLFIVLSLFSCTLASVHGQGNSWVPSNLHKRENLGEKEITVTLALSHRNVPLLEERFWAVSSPSHIDYGKHMSFDEVTALVAPSQDSIDVMYNYFQENGVPAEHITLHQSRDFMTVRSTVAKAEALFQTSYEPYHHKRTGDLGVGMRDGKYSLDETLRSRVDFIPPISRLHNVPRVSRSVDDKRSVKYEIVENHDSRSEYKRSTGFPPLVLPQGNDESALVNYILVCPDGSAPTFTYKRNDNTVACGPIKALYLNVTVVSTLNSQVTNAFSINLVIDTSLDNCVNYPTSCVAASYYNNYTMNGVYGYYILSTGLPNYSPYYVTMQITYSDGSVGAKGQSYTIESSPLFTPQAFSTQYGVPTTLTAKSPYNSQSVAAFEGQSCSTDDLKSFFQQYQIQDYSKLLTIVNPEYNDAKNPGSEANLDVQTVMSNARNVSTYFWPMNNTGSNVDDHLAWIMEVLNTPNPPFVHSVSYGNGEIEFDVDYMTRTNIEFMKAGVRGLTLIYASGDSGAFSDKFYNRTAFTPSFPSTSPYVTAVGASQLYSSDAPSCYTGVNYTCMPVEIACSIATGAAITSGGGFSNIFHRPSYQDTVVPTYIAKLPRSVASFNSSNRAYPDVAMNGHNIPLMYFGTIYPVDGTSASAPFFAAFVSLLNDIRMSSGNAPLGFLNPFIYNLSTTSFNDITQGDNGCTSFGCKTTGYPTEVGFDAVTGFGTPIFSQWVSAVASLPASPYNYTQPTSTTSTTSTSSKSSTTASPSSSTTSPSSAAFLSVTFGMVGMLAVSLLV